MEKEIKALVLNAKKLGSDFVTIKKIEMTESISEYLNDNNLFYGEFKEDDGEFFKGEWISMFSW